MAATHGFRHDLLVYDEPMDLATAVVPFIQDGLGRGDLVVVRAQDATWTSLCSQLSDSDAVALNPLGDLETHPHHALWGLRQLVDKEMSDRRRPVRVWTDTASPPLRVSDWGRAESVLNELFRVDVVWVLCSALRDIGTELVDTALRTHPTLSGSGERSGGLFEPTREFLLDLDSTDATDPMESDPPRATGRLSTMKDLAAARADLERALADIDLDAWRRQDVLAAVFEIAANAMLHGGPSAMFRVWVSDDRFLCLIRDGGAGPSNPLMGYHPPGPWSDHGGAGMWTARQLCDLMTTTREAGGFTVRLSVDV